jgi:hypothetical protein
MEGEFNALVTVETPDCNSERGVPRLDNAILEICHCMSNQEQQAFSQQPTSVLTGEVMTFPGTERKGQQAQMFFGDHTVKEAIAHECLRSAVDQLLISTAAIWFSV